MKKPNIDVRRMQFGLSEEAPRYWNDNDPFKTHFFNAISCVLPKGERFFIDSLRENLPFIKDPQLIDDIKKFMGQEGCHDNQHVRYNNILRAQGYDIDALESRVGRHLSWTWKIATRKMRLALTVSFEHFTTILADTLLQEETWLDNADPTYAALWRWHAIEEIEHKAVTYDAYKAVGGGYFQRVREAFAAAFFLWYHVVANHLYFLYKDKQLFKWKVWCSGMKFLWGRSGIMRRLIPLYFKFYKPGFHPWQHDNLALADKWRHVYKDYLIESRVDSE